MKKVRIITRHAPSNYGSLLQSIATEKILNGMGCDAKIIDYERLDECGFNKVWIEACKKTENVIKRFVYTTIRYPIEKYAELRFRKMRSYYLNMTDLCRTHKDLSLVEADIFMTGSDQVWGPMVNGKYDSAYFLSFVQEGGKTAYAASFGKTKFDDETVSDYQDMLASYDKIAVREKSAVMLLDKWGVKNCIGQVLDPTLLFDGNVWADLMIPEVVNKKYRQKKYVLVYQIHNDSNLSVYAKNLAKKKNLELLRVNPFMHQFLRGGKFINCPDVSVFLSLIKNSTYMVTDSFHGTCFAINFNKEFVEILPNNATSTRNQSILILTGLSDRIIVDYKDFTIVDKKIDYLRVNDILRIEREKSLRLMKRIIE